MTPVTIEAAHGRKLIAVVVPKEATDFEVTYAFGIEKFKDASKMLFYHMPGGNRFGGRNNTSTFIPESKGNVALKIVGTLHHDGKDWVSSFDVEPFVDCLDKHFGIYRYYGRDIVDAEKCTVRGKEAAFISLLNSYGVGYLNNPLGERPDDIDDLGAFTQHRRKQIAAWLNAEEGVLQSNQQIVFIEQL